MPEAYQINNRTAAPVCQKMAKGEPRFFGTGDFRELTATFATVVAGGPTYFGKDVRLRHGLPGGQSVLVRATGRSAGAAVSA
jgi:hypothetical protein